MKNMPLVVIININSDYLQTFAGKCNCTANIKNTVVFNFLMSLYQLQKACTLNIHPNVGFCSHFKCHGLVISPSFQTALKAYEFLTQPCTYLPLLLRCPRSPHGFSKSNMYLCLDKSASYLGAWHSSESWIRTESLVDLNNCFTFFI